MRPLVLDTNVLISAFGHDCELPDEARSYDRVLLPATVVGEYKAGITDSRLGRENARKLESYLRHQSVDVIPVTDTTAGYYAKVFQALKAAGRPIPQNDIWIAASALEHGAAIVTFDRHFRAVPMLTVIVPEET